MYQQNQRQRRGWKRVMTAAVVAGLAIVAVADNNVTVKKVAYILADKDPLADPVETVETGTQLQVLERKNGWVNVKTPSGKVGFISQDDLPGNVNVSGLKGAGTGTLSTSAASKGLQDDAASYSKDKKIDKEPLETLLGWGDAISSEDLKKFDKGGHVGSVTHR